MFIILHHKRVIQRPILCWGNVHAISPSFAVLGVYFPTPKKKWHALYCTDLMHYSFLKFTPIQINLKEIVISERTLVQALILSLNAV